jgi:dynein heavy chain
MTYKDFNLLYHIHLVPEPPALEEGEPEEDLDIRDEDTVYQRKVVRNLDQIWLKLKPSQDIFFHDLIMLISDGLNCLQSFERWSRHDEMTPYVSVLEEWDDLVGDDWEQPISNFLNP